MIEIKNLTKIYHTDEEGSLAINNVSIVFPETGFVALTGESGSGKTTLLNVLSGFLGYEEGDFFVDGVDFLSFTEEDLNEYHQKKVGFVFQDYHLLESHTVVDNLIEALLIIGVNESEAKEKSLKCLELFGLDEQKNLKVRNLSSGQKQRLSIARAMIKEPNIILCDEPTANLDSENGKKILKILKDYSKNHLVILSTHNYEDAQEFVTHFVRLYKGNLTSYKEVNHDYEAQEIKQEKKGTNPFSLALFAFKNHKFRTTFKTLISSFFIAMIAFLIVLFAANTDEYATRIVSRKVFNNVSKEELVIRKKDGSALSEDDLVPLRSINHVVGTQLYGIGTEMNYYYREDIDFKYDKVIIKEEKVPEGGGMPDIIEHIEETFVALQDNLFIKSVVGRIEENDLSVGALPTDYYEVVANSDYHVGDTISVHFVDEVLQGYYVIDLDFKVTGILKNYDDNLYFSNNFLKQMDYIQYYSTNPILRFGCSYTNYDRYGTEENKRNETFYLYPLYNPNLNDLDIQYSTAFYKNFLGSISRFAVVDVFYAHLYGTPFDTRLIGTMNDEELTCDDLGMKYVYVGKDIIPYYLSDYQSYTARILIDNYANIDDVIYSLTNYKFDCLSAYRASTTEYNSNKQMQRAVTLIVSLVLVVVGAVIAVFIISLMERSELNDDKTLYLLGANDQSLRKKSLIKLGIITLVSLLIGVGLYLITLLIPVPFLVETNIYLRFYHILIVVVISALIGILSWLSYNRSLNKQLKKGVAN